VVPIRPPEVLPESASHILRALPAHVALVDPGGVVVEVNEAWRRFAQENGWPDPRAGVGRNYLEACDEATGRDEADGRLVAAGLRAVLGGREPRFEHEYPCHGPAARRWFRLVATAAGGGRGAVVMHVDVTEQRLFEDALRENAGQLRNAQRLAGLGYFHMDLPTGRLTLAEETVAMLGWPAAELREWPGLIRHVHRRQQLPLTAELEALLASRGSLDTQVRFFRPDGTMRWLRIRAEAMAPASALQRIAGIFMDVTERRAAGEAMRASQERYRRLSDHLHDMLENMPDGFFTVDPQWRITYLNSATERLVGASREGIIGRNIWDLYPAEEAAFRPHYERAIATGRPVEFEAWSPQLGKWTELRIFTMREGVGVYLRDVTESRAIRERLRASEERFARVAEATTDAIWDWDAVRDRITWYRGLERVFGVAIEGETPPDFWSERLHPEERVDILAGLERAMAGGSSHWSGEYRFRRADGSYAWVQDRAFIMRGPDGKVLRLVGGMSDVTEQRRDRERLEEQARLLDNARDAIHVRDLEHRVQYLNRSAEALYGWSAAEARGRSIQALLHRDPGAFRRAMDHLLLHGEWSGEMGKVARDGRAITVEARWTLLRDAQGTPRRILAIDTDVTERRALERQLIRSQRLDSIGTLAGGIAHDLNNVFTPILMAANLLDTPERGPEEAGLVQAVRTSAQRGVDMVGKLMSFARGSDGERTPVLPGDVVAGVLPIVSETFPKDIVVETQVEPRLAPVLGDATQLHQVLLNLCVNARDAMPHGGTLRLSARTAPESSVPGAVPCIAFEVEDTGTGIAPEHLEKLWDPFFTTKAPGQGTGLGLPTSLSIVKGHGGQIHVRSKPGEGSRFTVLLPALPDAMPARSTAPPAAIPRGDGRHVLVVDDEAPIRQVARRVLEANGYRVSEAGNGAEALDAYRASGRAIDTVLLDLMMPVMDGAEAIEALRSIDPEVRIVATTGYTTPERLARVVEAGIPYLPKPYTPDALLRAVAGPG
jgi:PAS domain S-box-containing protein